MRGGLHLGLSVRLGGLRSGDSTPAPPPTPATLTLPTDAANGSTAMTGTVTTDRASGTLYWFISTSATPPTAANLKAAVGAVAAGSQAVTATGVQNIADTGLTASTAYFTHYLQTNAGGDSNIATADGFTTEAEVADNAPLTKLVAEGDSISAASGSYVSRWSAANSGVPFVNRAVGGSGIATMQSRIANVISDAPSHLSILIGANDLMGSYPSAEAFVAALFGYISDVRAGVPGIKVLVCGILPIDEAATANAPPAKNGFNVRRGQVNALLRSAVGNEIDGYIPLGDHPEMTDAAGANTVYFPDGLHPDTPAQVLHQAVFSAVFDSILQQDTGTNPDAFALQDVSGATPSTPYTSLVLVSGMGTGRTAAASISGAGDFRRGYGAYGTAPQNVLNGDYVTRRITSSAAANTAVSGDLTIGSRADTMTVDTTVSVVAAANLQVWYDPGDLSTMAQTNTGTGTVAADADPIGTLNDKSGQGHHLTSAANGATRPLFKTDGTYRWIASDGVDDVLRRMGSTLNMRLNAPWTIAVAIKAQPGSSRLLFGHRGAINGSPTMIPLSTVNTSGVNGTVFYRDAANVSATGGDITVNRYTNLWDNAHRVVILVFDGTNFTYYKDGVAGTSWAGSENGGDYSGGVNLGLFGGMGATPGNYFKADLYQLQFWNKALDASELAQVNAQFSATYGGSL